MPAPQNYKNHVRVDPVWHYFIVPVLILHLAFSIYETIHFWPNLRGLFLCWIVLALVLLFAVFRARQHSLVVQNRVIRLEEKFRYAALLPPDLLARSEQLTLSQIIALRFASDAELPTLVKRALDHNMSCKQIKEAIENWRPDYLRV